MDKDFPWVKSTCHLQCNHVANLSLMVRKVNFPSCFPFHFSGPFPFLFPFPRFLSRFPSRFPSHFPSRFSSHSLVKSQSGLAESPFQKSVNLQYVTLGCLDDGTNESSTKSLMFQVIFFYNMLFIDLEHSKLFILIFVIL